MLRLTQDPIIKVFLSLVVVLLGLQLLVSSNSLAPRPVQAAGVPDTGSQFQVMIDELKDVNKRLDTLQRYMESGALTVKVKSVGKDGDK